MTLPHGDADEAALARYFARQHQLQDATADAVAMIEAVRRDDGLALAVLAKHADRDAVLAVAIKLLAADLRERGVEPEWFRRWSVLAVRRP